MGAQLVAQVLVYWTDLSDRAFRVLVRMALTALDNDGADGRPAGRYFGGRELLMMSLRAPYVAPDTDPKAHHSLVVQLDRAVKELKKAGAIEPLVEHPRIGRQQVYQLALAPTLRWSSFQRSVGPEHQRSVVESTNAPLVPRNQEEPSIGAIKEYPTHRLPKPQDARARSR
jgi:hypothetical protein